VSSRVLALHDGENFKKLGVLHKELAEGRSITPQLIIVHRWSCFYARKSLPAFFQGLDALPQDVGVEFNQLDTDIAMKLPNLDMETREFIHKHGRSPEIFGMSAKGKIVPLPHDQAKPFSWREDPDRIKEFVQMIKNADSV
jgi:hypothetical protein